MPTNIHTSGFATIAVADIKFTDGSIHQLSEFPGAQFTWTLVSDDASFTGALGTVTPSGDTLSCDWRGANAGAKAHVHCAATIAGKDIAGDTDECDWSTEAVPGSIDLTLTVNG